MANVEAFIWHDPQGKIIAVGHLAPGCKEKIEPLARPGHKVLKLHVPEEQLRTLHLTHTVDLERSILYPHSRKALGT